MILHSDWRTAALADLVEARPELASMSITAAVRDACKASA